MSEQYCSCEPPGIGNGPDPECPKHRPSNLVAELRDQAEAFKTINARGLVRIFTAAADELERLTRERDSALYEARNWKDRHDVMQAAKKRAECDAMAAEAERDRLALECAAYKEARSTDNRNLLAHIDRLRAALERLRDHPKVRLPDWADQIVREALRGEK